MFVYAESIFSEIQKLLFDR